MEWEPLPPRKKKSKSVIEVETQPHQSTADINKAEIDSNVQARSEMTRAEASLEGKDGCAGEFYECVHLIAVYFAASCQ